MMKILTGSADIATCSKYYGYVRMHCLAEYSDNDKFVCHKCLNQQLPFNDIENKDLERLLTGLNENLYLCIQTM